MLARLHQKIGVHDAAVKATMIKEHRDSAEAFSRSCRSQYEAKIADLEDKLRLTQVSCPQEVQGHRAVDLL